MAAEDERRLRERGTGRDEAADDTGEWVLEGPSAPTPDAAAADLASDLADSCRGDVRFDEYTRVLYATDGSIYSAQPAGVVFPRDVDDVQAAVRVASAHDVPVLPRGAGSSLAGQAVGPGCVVLDLSKHMDSVLEVDTDARLARVQPGVVQDDLDAVLEPHGLKFAPDPASSNRATVGGGIGNNSTGAHSVRYGITDAYTEELRVVLPNGEVIHTREVVLDGPEYDEIVEADTREAAIYRTVRQLVEENHDEIDERYPDLKRRVTGYNLDRVIYERADGERVINLSKLLVGAEGTLGVVVEATVSLVTRPGETALALYCFPELQAALRAVPEALEYPVSAVELMDEEVFRLARESDGYAQYAEPIPEETAAALLLEWDDELVSGTEDGDDDGHTQRAAFEAAVAETTAHFVDDGDAFEVLEAYTESAQADLWNLRKAAIPLLMSLEGDPKPYPFIEDATVPPEELAAYVADFEAVLEDHDTEAAYFAHAGSGTLHIRPILNLKSGSGVEAMRSITDDVTDLVLERGGSFSGEHGDGMARTEFTPKMYGEDLWEAFKRVKTAFDPDWLMHPGNVVYRDGPGDVGPDSERGVGADVRDHLRYGPSYSSLEPQTTLDFEPEGGFSHLVELCNGCGTCRQRDGDVMCPTYRASDEEIETTRGRANLLRAAISGDLSPEERHSEQFQTAVLDHCIGCKGCQRDCPTGVDLAKLKAEVKHPYHEREGVTLRERLFADIDRFAAIGSTLAPVANRLPQVPGARSLLERTVGIAAERSLPTFHRESLVEWFESRGADGASKTRAAAPRAKRGPQVDADEADLGVVLVPDTDTNYSNPDRGKAAVALLEAANVHVRVPDLGPTGRAAYSQGLLETAREQGEAFLDDCEPFLERGWSILFVEPSDGAMVLDEYSSLLDVDDSDLERLQTNTFGVCEYVDEHGLDGCFAYDREAAARTPLVYHGHCHETARGAEGHAISVLERAGYDVTPVDSTCCGMAGSFGYEAEHYDLSREIGRLLRDQLVGATTGNSSERAPTGGSYAGDESKYDADRSPGPVVDDGADAVVDATVVATGTSCRTQIGDFDGFDDPLHPVEALVAVLED
ncbi:FAD-binding and (Fe-S)-binding domain-containing protein [Natrarchaeobaculum aegyptiacum]|uniref:FAD-binding oxidoreductase n=1 Tax=Natrarchaeobaculum aegyptiacum TaxID=745377 RepID=A0A2Z2HUB1_9EURY|nr:FAD-binding and (Fe-S)-binding domain-containing protein [Natrarchaeobaculum aegyptiacum]ARS90841.1 FAD-binding oxidoreductase [Natrarchaeobaculum aegyptiacum]